MKEQQLTLRALVNELISGLVTVTGRNKSFIINEVPYELNLATNTELVSTVLHHLFTTVALHSSESCIRICAKTYSNVILVQVRDQNSPNSYTIAQGLQATQPIAEKIGGFLGITSQRKNETVIVFSFPNLPAAA